MAANMKAVKLRIKSVESTMQITKAMELVASSKLRKAKERADTCRPYFQELYRTLQDIAKGNTEFYSIYAKEAKNEKCCYVLVAGDRGLAGGYNANLFRCFQVFRLRKSPASRQHPRHRYRARYTVRPHRRGHPQLQPLTEFLSLPHRE